MKIIFLDFDGVLNSEASFRLEQRRKTLHVSDTLSDIACSNLQYILEQDSSVRIVISSTWRKLHTLEELKSFLQARLVDGSKVIGKTPAVLSCDRAHEINLWLGDNPGVTKFVVIDDDLDVLAITDPRGRIFQTSWEDGLLFAQAEEIARLFREAK